MLVWVVDGQAFRRGGLKLVGIGRNEGQRGCLACLPLRLHLESRGEVYGIITAQSVLLGEPHCPFSNVGTHLDDLVAIPPVLPELGRCPGGCLRLGLAGPHPASEGGEHLWPCHAHRVEEVAKASIRKVPDPSCPCLADIPFCQGTGVQVVRRHLPALFDDDL